MRTRTSLALLAAAALAATGCLTVQKLNVGALKQPGTAFIVTGEDQKGDWVCSVSPATIVIDTTASAQFADQVTWLRFGDMRGEVRFSLKNGADRSIFPNFHTPIPDRAREKKSGKPQNVPSAGYMVGYTVEWKNATCDPDICIRKNQTGCEAYLTQ